MADPCALRRHDCFRGNTRVSFQPLYKKLLQVFRYESLTAFITIIIATVIVFVPLGFFGLRVFGEASGLYVSLSSHGGFDLGGALTTFFRTHFPSLEVPVFTFNFSDYARQGLTWLLQNFGSFFSSVSQIFFTAFLSLLGLFYFLKDGERFKEWLLNIVPLTPEYSEEIIHEMEAMGSSVIRGTLMIAVVQGLVMGVGFFFFRIPNPIFWGVLTVPVSVVPIVGTWLVVIPAVAYLLFTGQTAVAIGLLVWSIILVNLVYNLLSPQLIRHRGVNLHPYLILLSVLGGIGVFGPIGFLMGPLVMALLFSLLKIYTKLIAAAKRRKS